MVQTTIDLTDTVCEDADVCINHISLTRREIRKLREEQNPSVECAICDGYNYNCSQYHCSEDSQID